ncbi:MAG: hypothetical protein AAF732_24090, partial [Pseudomonadota bacterium]
MRVEVVAKLFDPFGHLVIRLLPGQNLGSIERRTEKSRTLDGGVVVNDRGFTHGDRTIELVYKPISDAHDATAKRLVENHPRVLLGTHEGVFEGVPRRFEPAPEGNRFRIEII